MVVVATEAAVTEVAAAATVAALRVARMGGAELAVEMEAMLRLMTDLRRATAKTGQTQRARASPPPSTAALW